MSESSNPIDDSDFSQALSTLIENAYNDGIDIEGAWKCSIDGNGDFHWDVQITRVKYDG
ncbi:MAG: hypothetical protein ABEJ79_04325 [Halolamina sp.]